jgi:hypothetical protein
MGRHIGMRERGLVAWSLSQSSGLCCGHVTVELSRCGVGIIGCYHCVSCAVVMGSRHSRVLWPLVVLSQRVGLGRMLDGEYLLWCLKYTMTMNNIHRSSSFGCHVADGDVAPGFHD